MNTNFVPDAGTLFYVTYRPRDRVDGGFVTETVVTTFVDRSYSDDIFKCVAKDSVLLVAEFLTRNKEKINFRLDQVYFSPVGPEVLAALGLVEEGAA